MKERRYQPAPQEQRAQRGPLRRLSPAASGAESPRLKDVYPCWKGGGRVKGKIVTFVSISDRVLASSHDRGGCRLSAVNGDSVRLAAEARPGTDTVQGDVEGPRRG